MRVDRVACAPSILLVSRALHNDRVVDCAFPRGVEWAHVKDINTLHLAENFETFKTRRLVEVGGDGADRSTGWKEIIFGVDVCAVFGSVFMGLVLAAVDWKKRSRVLRLTFKLLH